jgi:hypothetical protein
MEAALLLIVFSVLCANLVGLDNCLSIRKLNQRIEKLERVEK